MMHTISIAGTSTRSAFLQVPLLTLLTNSTGASYYIRPNQYYDYLPSTSTTDTTKTITLILLQ